MSITFYLKNNRTVKIKNPNFNELEHDDEFYNPRFFEESIYPELNVSNANAGLLLKVLKIDFKYAGEILNKDLDEFLFTIERVKQSITFDPKYSEEDRLYLTKRLQHLDKVARYASALNTDLVWN